MTSVLDKVSAGFWQDVRTHNAKSATIEAGDIHLFIKDIAVDPTESPEQFPESTGIIVLSRASLVMP